MSTSGYEDSAITHSMGVTWLCQVLVGRNGCTRCVRRCDLCTIRSTPKGRTACGSDRGIPGRALYDNTPEKAILRMPLGRVAFPEGRGATGATRESGGPGRKRCHWCHSGEGRSRKEEVPLGRGAVPEGRSATRERGGPGGEEMLFPGSATRT